MSITMGFGVKIPLCKGKDSISAEFYWINMKTESLGHPIQFSLSVLVTFRTSFTVKYGH